MSTIITQVCALNVGDRVTFTFVAETVTGTVDDIELGSDADSSVRLRITAPNYPAPRTYYLRPTLPVSVHVLDGPGESPSTTFDTHAPVLPARLLNVTVEGTIITVQDPETGAVLTGSLLSCARMSLPERVRVQLDIDGDTIALHLPEDHPYIIAANAPQPDDEPEDKPVPHTHLNPVQAIAASGICGFHRDRMVRFTWRFPTSGIRATILGELREVHHDAEGVTLWLIAEDGGSASEFIVSPDTIVEVGK